MAHKHLVTVVGATGAQGGAVVRLLIATDKYKVSTLIYFIILNVGVKTFFKKLIVENNDKKVKMLTTWVITWVITIHHFNSNQFLIN